MSTELEQLKAEYAELDAHLKATLKVHSRHEKQWAQDLAKAMARIRFLEHGIDQLVQGQSCAVFNKTDLLQMLDEVRSQVEHQDDGAFFVSIAIQSRNARKESQS